MFKKIIRLIFFGWMMLSSGAVNAQEDPVDLDYYQNLIPLHEVKLPPGENDWMMHNREPGQSIFEYVKAQPVRPDDTRKYIYIVTLGKFGDEHQQIMQTTARYIATYFQLEVKFLDPLDLSIIPNFARRIHPLTNDRQILTTYILEDVLGPKVPDDAISLIAFTTSDLWPGDNWNFVFGQASIADRVGVWSVYRNGDPRKSQEDYKLCLLRTIKTGTHELGHMFSIPHCPYFECNMNGSNHRLESDRRPLWLCPVDLSKLMWNIGIDPDQRFQQLIDLSEELGFDPERDFYQRSLNRGQTDQ